MIVNVSQVSTSAKELIDVLIAIRCHGCIVQEAMLPLSLLTDTTVSLLGRVARVFEIQMHLMGWSSGNVIGQCARAYMT